MRGLCHRAQIGGIVSQHVGGGDKLDRAGDIATLDGARIESRMALGFLLAIRHGRRHLGPLVALGKCACESRHDNLETWFVTPESELTDHKMWGWFDMMWFGTNNSNQNAFLIFVFDIEILSKATCLISRGR